MKHYKTVKRSAFFLIAISAFAVIFNSLLLGATAVGLISLSRPTETKAVDSCSGTGVTIDLEPAATTFQLNEKFLVYLKVTDLTRTYKYKVYAKDVATNKPYEKTSEIILTPADGGGATTPISITRVGKFAIYASYIMFDEPSWCENWTNTNEIPITIGDNTTNSANITITITPEKTDQGGTAVIGYTIAGALNKTYALYISQGGTCPNDLDNPKCWEQWVTGLNIFDDPLTDSYNWGPTTLDKTGRHAIMIKLFDKASGEMTDKKIAYTTVCALGTAATTCVADNGDTGDTGGDTSGDVITTPDTIDAVGRFTSAFKMPKSIKGPGDLITVIIKLLEYLIGAFAFIGLVVSGIQYISSGGDPAKAEKAKKTLTYCVIGIIIAVLSLSIEGIFATFWGGPT